MTKENIIKNLKDAKISHVPAKAIAAEIIKSTENFHSNKVINTKLDRVLSHVDAKIYTAKANIIKWFIGIAMLQIIINFTSSLWGF